MPMKVTVCFDRIKVLVPCGDGDLLVRELIEKAIIRYKKAIGKSSNHWVTVHTLRTVDEDSILDADDTLNDVVDDREQLVADFEELGAPGIPHNGDGQSVSSVGTSSPDIFQIEQSHQKGTHLRGYSLDGGNAVVVTDRDISVGSGLTVRRGSEPALNVVDDQKSSGTITNGSTNCLHSRQDSSETEHGGDREPVLVNGDAGNQRNIPLSVAGEGGQDKLPFGRFARDSWRQSLGNQPNMFKWLEAQERQEDKYREGERIEPVGGAVSPEPDEEIAEKPSQHRQLPPIPPHQKPRDVGIRICLKNDGTALGIHVVPDFDDSGRENGLMVQGIEPGRRIDQDGRLRVDDRIIEINGNVLIGVSFPKAQEIFRSAMQTEEVQLKVVKHSVHKVPKRNPPIVLPKPRGHAPVKPSPLTLSPQSQDLNSSLSSPEQTSTPLDYPNSNSFDQSDSNTKSLSQSDSTVKSFSHSDSSKSSSFESAKPIRPSSPVKAVSPVKKAPPPPPTRNPLTSLSAASTSETSTKSPPGSATNTLTKTKEIIIAPTNTKKLGKRIAIDLVKGRNGLGFSITTRDNPAGGDTPIYIKNIQVEGAAVSDGRLKAGDRLLEVNGHDMTGKIQGDAVSILRNTQMGNTVNIVVSRQEVQEQDERFKVPRELPLDKAGDDGTLALMKNKELLLFDIALNDSGSAGLGVSVKGKVLTTEEGTRDLGIFVKAVIHGGAASKDGRLQVNDQLLVVNNHVLTNLPNTEAMDTLRSAMQEDGPLPGCINIHVARRIGAPSPSPFTSPSSFEYDIVNKDVIKKKEENNNLTFGDISRVANDGEKSPVKSEPRVPEDFKSPNMFLDRIMAGNGLRNQSYMRANHESYVESPEPMSKKGRLIELSPQKPRPHSTLGIERRSPAHSDSSSSEDVNQEPAWLHGPDWTRHPSQTSEESELSPMGDGFTREGFGRQSMSEKRKGHSDPRSSETYQRAKGVKDLYKGLQKTNRASGGYGRLVRSGSADSLLSHSNSHVHGSRNVRDVHDKFSSSNIRGPPPPTNLKRFNSLENLSTMQTNNGDTDKKVEPDVSGSLDDSQESQDSGPHPRMARRRGGNESFRAAVDRSYDPVPHLDMEPLEEESSEGGSVSQDPSNSARSSLSDHPLVDDPFNKKKVKKMKERNKSGGILKGIFKFGRGRKTTDDHLTKDDIMRVDDPKVKVDTTDAQYRQHQEQMWRQSQDEQDRVQQELRRMQEQYHLEQQRQQQQQGSEDMTSADPDSMTPMSRAEKIKQLREDHQRRHRERQGHYPQEDREEEYEKQIQEDEVRDGRFTTDDYFLQKYGQSAIPSQGPADLGGQRSQGQRSQPSGWNQVDRPPSRSGPAMGASDQSRSMTQFPRPDVPPPQYNNRHVSDSNIRQGNYYRPLSRGPTPSHDQVFRGQTPTNENIFRGQTPTNEHAFRPPASTNEHVFSGQTPTNEHNYRGPTPTHEHRGQTPTNEHNVRGPAPMSDRSNYAHVYSRAPVPSYDTRNHQVHPASRGLAPPTDPQGRSYDPQGQPYDPQGHSFYPPPKAHKPTVESRYYQTDPDIRHDHVINVSKNRDHVTRGDHVTRTEAPPGGGYYGNPISAYRDPVYSVVAGKRQVKTVGQPNSAKV